jgi:hypothetical protein
MHAHGLNGLKNMVEYIMGIFCQKKIPANYQILLSVFPALAKTDLRISL